MEKRQKILVVVDAYGGYTIMGEDTDNYDVFWIDFRDLEEDDYREHKEVVWAARDMLVGAEHWPDFWKRAVNIEYLCELVENEGIELPDWIRAHRDDKLLETLRQLETM